MFGNASFAVKLTVFCVGCAALWFVSPALVVGVYACGVAGVTLGFLAMLVLTNWLHMNYEVAGVRGFWSGIVAAAAAIAGYATYLGVAGGAGSGLESHLWQAATTVAIAVSVTAIVVVSGWALLIALAPRLSE